MKKCYIVIFSIILAILSSSCDKIAILKNNDAEKVDEKEKWTSELTKDEEFCKTLHILRNPYTDAEAVVRADGTIILNAMQPNNESFKILKDEKTGEQKYISKTIHGERLEKHTYTYSDGEENTYSDASLETFFYDKDGNDIGLSINSFNALYAIKDSIIYYENDNDYDERELYIYNVKNKSKEAAPKSQVSYFGSHIIFSSDGYGYDKPSEYNKEILICDDDLNVISKIEGYSYASDISINDKSIGVLMCDDINNKDVEYKDLVYEKDYTRLYNYIDENFNLIFDTPVNNRINFDNGPIVTIHSGDIEYDFDFSTLTKVSEDRPYSGFENNNDKYQIERQKHADISDKIKNKNEKYLYVETKIYNDIVLFLAFYSGDYDEETSIYQLPCDIYSIDGELLLQVDNLVSTYEESGYFLVDYEKIYNFNLDIVKEFPEKTYLSMVRVDDKIFFEDNMTEKYDNKEHYNFFDDKLNVIFENVDDVINYTYDNYLIVISSGVTKIIDKNINVIKEFDGRYDIRAWYSNEDTEYRAFTNLDTKRMGIVDGDYNIIVDGLKSVQSLEEKCFAYANGFRYGLMDYKNNIICDFSIFNTMTEDSNKEDYNLRYIE